MSNDRLSGMALIAGSAGMIITMGLHPSGHVPAQQIEPMIRLLIAVHALGLACLPVLFLGAWGLSGHIGLHKTLAVTGIVVYGFALLAIMNAAVVDGLVTPPLLRQIIASAGSPQSADGWNMMQHFNFYVNQAYAQVFVVASSVAIVLWSASICLNRELPRGLGIYGCVLGPVTVAALLGGHLSLDRHGFGIVVLGQAVWFITAGVLLMGRKNQLSGNVT